jgi:ribosomal protein L40E
VAAVVEDLVSDVVEIADVLFELVEELGAMARRRWAMVRLDVTGVDTEADEDDEGEVEQEAKAAQKYKECTQCAKRSHEKAEVCKHCGHSFLEAEAEPEPESEPEKPKKTFQVCKACKTRSGLKATHCRECGLEFPMWTKPNLRPEGWTKWHDTAWHRRPPDTEPEPEVVPEPPPGLTRMEIARWKHEEKKKADAAAAAVAEGAAAARRAAGNHHHPAALMGAAAAARRYHLRRGKVLHQDGAISHGW